jgi:hypothetical protein
MKRASSPMTGMSAPPATWEAFWRFYVREHRDPRTRRMHFAGTSLAILCLAGAALWQSLWLAVAAPVIAYGFAWLAHFAVEGNSPATFRHPLWSLMADGRMFALMCTGRMDAEVRRLGGDGSR